MTILLIEDEENDAVLLGRALRRAAGGTRIQVFRHAEQAVEYLDGVGKYADRQRHPLPALIIMDLSLPGMSGVEFLGWIREQPGLKEIPVVVLSGSPFFKAVEQAYALGAKTFFTKPVDSSELERLAQSIALYWSASASTSPAGEEQNEDDDSDSPAQSAE